MKKKIILAIVAVMSLCSFAAGLTACAKKEHEHNYEATVVAPTCTELGYTVHTCNECQHSYVDTYVVALGHSYTNYVSNGNATCTADGVRTYTATVTLGGETYTDEKSEAITKLGHDFAVEWSWTDYTSATATFTCANDGTHVENVTATGEAITSVVTTPATCTADGVRTYTATVTLGGETYTDEKNETLTKLGHSYTNYISNGDATCTADGTKTAVCDHDGCNETHTVTDEGTKLGHDLVHHNAKSPTCTEVGWGEYDTCSRCDYTTYKELPAKGHTPATAVEENRVEATCEQDGHYDSVVYCSVCNAEISREEKTLTKLGHSYGDPVWSWRDYIRATATFTCSHNKTHFVTETATGEAITSAVTTPATCTDDGEKTYTATVSFGGKTYTSTKDETLTMLGHSYGEPKWSRVIRKQRLRLPARMIIATL